jgi:hypothetical protein
MPYQKVDGTVVEYVALDSGANYDYNLAYTPNGCGAYGLALQIVYTGVTDITFKLQCSNDGENFMDISGTEHANVVADGSTLYDLGTPGYKILRVVLTVNSGTADFTLVFNAVNLS